MSRCIGCGHSDCRHLWPLRRKCCPDCSHGRKRPPKARLRPPVNRSSLPGPLPRATAEDFEPREPTPPDFVAELAELESGPALPNVSRSGRENPRRNPK